MIKIYPFILAIKKFDIKLFFMRKTYNTYKKSGVNMATADKLVKYISKIAKNTYKKNTESKNFRNIGSFGSIFDLAKLKMKNPVIVSSTDGVGTKIEIANQLRKFDTIGIDLVAMCVNDLIVQGAKPIFFLDYIAIGKLNLKKIKLILRGIFKGCNISDCETPHATAFSICDNCEVVSEINDQKLLKYLLDFKDNNGIKFEGYNLEFFGTCKTCKKKQTLEINH